MRTALIWQAPLVLLAIFYLLWVGWGGGKP
jgi:hypothetical protein